MIEFDDIDSYAETNIDELPYVIRVSRKNEQAARDWCENNINEIQTFDSWAIYEGAGNEIAFAFKHEKDAILFSLKWYDN